MQQPTLTSSEAEVIEYLNIADWNLLKLFRLLYFLSVYQVTFSVIIDKYMKKLHWDTSYFMLILTPSEPVHYLNS